MGERRGPRLARAAPRLALRVRARLLAVAHGLHEDTPEPRAVGWHKRFYSPSTRAEVDPAHRRLQFRNRYLMWFKNETWLGLLRDLPFWLPYELAQFAYVLLRERDLLGGYADAWHARGGARRRRRAVQGRRVVARPAFGLRPPRG